MIERYTKPEMGHIWTEYNEWDTMKQVEILASEAQAELGNIPKEAAKEIREKAAFSVDRIHEIEAETHHDIAAFVRASAVLTASMPKRRRSVSSCATGWLKSNATSTA